MDKICSTFSGYFLVVVTVMDSTFVGVGVLGDFVSPTVAVVVVVVVADADADMVLVVDRGELTVICALSEGTLLVVVGVILIGLEIDFFFELISSEPFSLDSCFLGVPPVLSSCLCLCLWLVGLIVIGASEREDEGFVLFTPKFN